MGPTDVEKVMRKDRGGEQRGQARRRRWQTDLHLYRGCAEGTSLPGSTSASGSGPLPRPSHAKIPHTRVHKVVFLVGPVAVAISLLMFQ